MQSFQLVLFILSLVNFMKCKIGTKLMCNVSFHGNIKCNTRYKVNARSSNNNVVISIIVISS